jgi:hemoglobin
LLDRIGGAPVMAAAVDGLYRRILADPDLAETFEDASVESLNAQKHTLLTSILAAPAYCRDPDAEHAGLAIEQRHYDLVAAYLTDALDELGVSRPLIDEVVGLAATWADDIVALSQPARGFELPQQRAPEKARAQPKRSTGGLGPAAACQPLRETKESRNR